MVHYLEVIFYVTILMVVAVHTSPASEIVTATIIMEAGGEYSEGAMEAIHEVITQRSKNRWLTKDQVCLQPFQFSCWNNSSRADLLSKAKSHPRWGEAFAITLRPVTSYTGGADHYHADYCNPYWNKHMKITAKIGRHIFYK